MPLMDKQPDNLTQSQAIIPNTAPCCTGRERKERTKDAKSRTPSHERTEQINKSLASGRACHNCTPDNHPFINASAAMVSNWKRHKIPPRARHRPDGSRRRTKGKLAKRAKAIAKRRADQGLESSDDDNTEEKLAKRAKAIAKRRADQGFESSDDDNTGDPAPEGRRNDADQEQAEDQPRSEASDASPHSPAPGHRGRSAPAKSRADVGRLGQPKSEDPATA